MSAAAFPVGTYLKGEMAARQWNLNNLVDRMGTRSSKEYSLDWLTVELLIRCPDTRMDAETSRKLALAFGLDDPEFFLRLDAAYHASKEEK